MTKQSGRADVLEIDAAERGPEEAHSVDELVDVLGRDFEVDGIDVGEALEEHRLAFHHRLRGERAEIAETEDGGAVGDDGDEVAARRVVEGGVRVLGDPLHRNGDARRIGERQVALRRHRLGRDDLELARPAARMEFQRLLVGDRHHALPALVVAPSCAFPRAPSEFLTGRSSTRHKPARRADTGRRRSDALFEDHARGNPCHLRHRPRQDLSRRGGGRRRSIFPSRAARSSGCSAATAPARRRPSP